MNLYELAKRVEAACPELGVTIGMGHGENDILFAADGGHENKRYPYINGYSADAMPEDRQWCEEHLLGRLQAWADEHGYEVGMNAEGFFEAIHRPHPTADTDWHYAHVSTRLEALVACVEHWAMETA